MMESDKRLDNDNSECGAETEENEGDESEVSNLPHRIKAENSSSTDGGTIIATPPVKKSSRTSNSTGSTAPLDKSPLEENRALLKSSQRQLSYGESCSSEDENEQEEFCSENTINSETFKDTGGDRHDDYNINSTHNENKEVGDDKDTFDDTIDPPNNDEEMQSLIMKDQPTQQDQPLLSPPRSDIGEGNNISEESQSLMLQSLLSNLLRKVNPVVQEGDYDNDDEQTLVKLILGHSENSLSRLIEKVDATDLQVKAIRNYLNQIDSLGSASELNLNNNTNERNANNKIGLSHDIFSLMMIEKFISLSWMFSVLSFSFQVALLVLVFQSQLDSWNLGTPWNVPYTVTDSVRTSQILAIFITVGISEDVYIPIKLLISPLWYTNEQYSDVIPDVGTKHNSFGRWLLYILFPNLVRFIEGALVMVVIFVTIIQVDDSIELFKDFAAMLVISKLDNIAFTMANHGYFGQILQEDTEKVKAKKFKDSSPACGMVPIRSIILSIPIILMIGCFSSIAIGQRSGDYFELKYPNCAIHEDSLFRIKNGVCDGGIYNTFQCGYDGGDCTDFNQAFPTCETLTPIKIGDGNCDLEFNIPQCGYDGGDCCTLDKFDPLHGDGKCHAGHYNSRECYLDNGDCLVFLENNPSCNDHEILDGIKDRNGITPVIGDGKCDFISEAFMTEECDLEDGDCRDCVVDDPSLLFNKKCDGGQYNTLACDNDNGACTECNTKIDNTSLIGDGFCNGGNYLLEECNYDGGDCLGCIVDDISKVGDGICDDNSMYNTKACDWDSADCNERNEEKKLKYPNCTPLDENFGRLGDGKCDDIFNNPECGKDDEDCFCLSQEDDDLCNYN
jgi:hypothetical protein